MGAVALAAASFYKSDKSIVFIELSLNQNVCICFIIVELKLETEKCIQDSHNPR